MEELYPYEVSLVGKIMFIETKNPKHKRIKNGIGFSDGNEFVLGGEIRFNNQIYVITTIPELDTFGEFHWVKLTFSVG
jgi:hypothetical protein